MKTHPTLKLIVCDWNGTLFRERYEETFSLGLCRRAFRRALWRGNVRKLARLTAHAVRCHRLYRAAKRDPDRAIECIARIVDLLNRDVFAGLSRAELERYVRRYARKIRRRLDARLLEPLQAVAAEAGIPIGVLSAGCREAIEAALDAAGYRFDFVAANAFSMEGGVTTSLHFAVADNKLALLTALLAERNIDPAEVMYIGDSPPDEPCFQAVGMPVVSFWARDTHKARFRQSCGAFVPADQADFDRHLRTAAGIR